MPFLTASFTKVQKLMDKGMEKQSLSCIASDRAKGHTTCMEGDLVLAMETT